MNWQPKAAHYTPENMRMELDGGTYPCKQCQRTHTIIAIEARKKLGGGFTYYLQIGPHTTTHNSKESAYSAAAEILGSKAA